MKDSYGYRPYRGSRVRRYGTILNILLTVAIVLAAIWVLSLLFPSEKGDAPQEGTVADGTAAVDSSAVDVDTAEADAPPAEENADASESEPSAALPAITKNPEKVHPIFSGVPALPENNRMFLCSAGELAGQAEALIALHQRGALTGVAVLMKDADGRLLYPSAIAAVQDEGDILRPVEGIEQTLGQLHAAGLALTAVMYAQEDDLFAEANEESALQNVEQVGWRDPDGRVYLDPANEEATGYLCAVASELKSLGFSEIILRGLGYPSRGTLTRIVYADDRFGAVTNFVAAVKTASPSMRVSVWLDSPGLAENADTGQAVSALCQASDRVFAEVPDDGAAALQQMIQSAAGGTEKLVFVTGDATGSEALASVLFDLPLSDLQSE